MKKNEKKIYYAGIKICERCGNKYEKYAWKCPRCGLSNPEVKNEKE